MHPNKIWLVFLASITLVVIWFSWGTVSHVMHYFSLEKKAKVIDSEWTILKIQDDQYQVQADFTFEYQEKQYRGFDIFEKPIYPNPWAAEYGVKEMKAKELFAWFYPKKPTNSSLEKHFPLKSILSSIILIGLWIYFIWVGFYVTQFRK
jgi:hypothetical protein